MAPAQRQRLVYDMAGVVDGNNRSFEFAEGLADTASAYFVYRLYAADRTLLYIGSTNNLLERLGNHAREKPWASRVVLVRTEAFTERSVALAAEREAVRLEKPRHNGVLYVTPEGLTKKEAIYWYNRRRSESRQHLRQKVCEVCSKEFTATRAHTKTCSPACKQKAYRQRKKAAGSTNG
jgi:predicted GIY-YIG superfamily endonuclease